MVQSGPTHSWVGANFWSRTGGPRMWVRYDGDVVSEELAVLARHGCNVTRSFCYWPDFVPEPERLDAAVLERFGDFLDRHAAAGLRTIPTFVVGHMSGENWDPAWRENRDLYRDVWLVAQQAWFVAEVGRRFGAHPAIAGWLLSNEMPLYGGPAPAEAVTSWARLLVQALRSSGAAQPVSVGDGAWGIEISGQDNGYSLRALGALVDFLGPHVYPMTDDLVRQHLSAAFACELCRTFGLPVVLEEFGVSSDFVAGENAAHYYRQVLHSSLLAGASGWLAWNNCDYDALAGQDPYRHHPFEMHFGLTDRDGRPKPQMLELERFSHLVAQLDATGYEPVPAEALIVVPEHFERELPFTTAAQRADIRAGLMQSYVAAREADLPVGFARERDGIPGGARLYLAPSAKQVTAPGAARLAELAAAGAVVYVSYFAGSTDNQRGPWFPWLDETFAVRQQLRYGLVDPVEDDALVLEVVVPFGQLAPGTRLELPVGGSASARARLPLEPAGAEVVALDQRGRPALLRRRTGAGQLVLCSYPVEHFAAATSRVNPDSSWRLYSALAAEAQVRRPVTVDDGRVAVGSLRTGDHETHLVLNLSDATVEVKLDGEAMALLAPSGPAAGGSPGATEAGGVAGPVGQLVLDPFEVAVLTSPLRDGTVP